MKAEKIIHRGESRIQVEFPFNQTIASVIKQIPGAKWSQTRRAWHIPYTREAFGQLKALFPGITLPVKENIFQASRGLRQNLPKSKPAIAHCAENSHVRTGESKEYPAPEVTANTETGLFTETNVNIYVFGRQIAIKLNHYGLSIGLTCE